ncbi:MAG: NAD(P)-binding protein [Leptolyngbya sp. SIO3F4]|nr:NAD(P)-binding protein [Leptolyngbya sp. SIO3F4]
MAIIAIVGAGVAGLTCGRMLQAAGHRVILLEKSRGVGGRLATRRLDVGGFVDHGAPYWAPQSVALKTLTQELLNQSLLNLWSAQGFVWDGQLTLSSTVAYCTEYGVNAIAKYLADGCDIRRQHRVTTLKRTAKGWRIKADGPDGCVQFSVDAVVLAIPAPQAVSLIDSLDDRAADTLRSVSYAPCLSLMVTYEVLPDVLLLDHKQGWHITVHDSVLAWVSLESSKLVNASGLHALLLQSQPDFAAQYLEQLDALGADKSSAEALLQKTVDQMLMSLATLIQGLCQPLESRLHRWRYSIVQQPYAQSLLTTRWPSLVACGDWCCPCPDDETNLDAASKSGKAAAAMLLQNFC